MTLRSARPWLAALAALAVAGAALASPADPRFSTFDPIGVSTSTGAGVGGSHAGFEVTLRDVNNAPLPGHRAQLDFSGTGLRVYTTQEAGTTVDAAAHTLDRQVLTVTGTVTFDVRGGGYTNTPTVLVKGDGVWLGYARWRSTDVDAADGRTSLADVNRVGDDYLGARVAPECNFDLSASDVPDLVDLTIGTREYMSGASDTYAW